MNDVGTVSGVSSGFFGALLGSNGMCLKPKKSLPCGRIKAAGTLRSVSASESGVMMRGPLRVSADSRADVLDRGQ